VRAMQTLYRTLLSVLLLAMPAVVRGQFNYTINPDLTITITGYGGPGGAVIIPDTIVGLPVIAIGSGAFQGYPVPSSITISTNVTSIASMAFQNCPSLSNISIPRSVTNLTSQSLWGCTRLKAITVDPLNSAYSSVDGVLFDKAQATLIQYPEAKAGSYAMPDSVTNIGSYAFWICPNLTNLTIGTNVITIGDRSFFQCTGLTNIIIPDSVITIGGEAFEWFTSLMKVTIGTKVTTLGDFAFAECTSLPRVAIPNSVTNIGQYAFTSCGSLTGVVVGDHVTAIGANAFTSCLALSGVYFKGNAPRLGSSVFSGANRSILYYMVGTTGWTSPFGSRPAVLWNPRQINSGLWTNEFGFTITGNYMQVVVEGCTNLVSGIWFPLQTAIVSGGSVYFSDAEWRNYPARFYRIRSP
jgi:hypothetical protein